MKTVITDSKQEDVALFIESNRSDNSINFGIGNPKNGYPHGNQVNLKMWHITALRDLLNTYIGSK